MEETNNKQKPPDTTFHERFTVRFQQCFLQRNARFIECDFPNVFALTDIFAVCHFDEQIEQSVFNLSRLNYSFNEI